jgi:hypothetical protein
LRGVGTGEGEGEERGGVAMVAPATLGAGFGDRAAASGPLARVPVKSSRAMPAPSAPSAAIASDASASRRRRDLDAGRAERGTPRRRARR